MGSVRLSLASCGTTKFMLSRVSCSQFDMWIPSIKIMLFRDFRRECLWCFINCITEMTEIFNSPFMGEGEYIYCSWYNPEVELLYHLKLDSSLSSSGSFDISLRGQHSSLYVLSKEFQHRIERILDDV